MSTLRTLLGLARLTAARVVAVLRPVVGIVTPLGWIVAGLAFAAGLAGGILGWPEFTYLALTLAAGLLVAFAFLAGRARFRVEVELRPRRVVAGERAFGRLLLTNTGARRSSPSRLELPVGRGVAEFAIPTLPAGAEHEELFAVPTQKRAVIVAGPALSVRGDPLGLVRRSVRWSDPVELFVHPPTVRLRPSAAGLVRDLEGEVTKAITNNDLAFHALRTYEPGDDRRYVHWRTTARTGRLMVRQFTETRRSQLVLLHFAESRGYASEGEFELGVSVLASIAQQVLRDGTKVRIASGAGELRTATPITMLDDSSRIEQQTTSATLRDFARDATKRMPAPSVLLVVVGSATPIGELRAASTLFGSDTRTIGLRMEAGGDARLALVGGVTVATIGALADLPKLIGKLS
ncbi:DUF58 domain-containing protein [Pseudolysinimonas sp.]|jgi:uncharacterized protein (DUF58 family)|uniref:DUF58 domain-containing protein n=1 Tax=Pseudolysinimonas sp. TaxID=2680009 RepID=UPI0037832FB6